MWNSDMSLSYRPYQTKRCSSNNPNSTAHYHTSCRSTDRLKDLYQIQKQKQSISRIRAQRDQAETLRREFERKDDIIVRQAAEIKLLKKQLRAQEKMMASMTQGRQMIEYAKRLDLCEKELSNKVGNQSRRPQSCGNTASSTRKYYSALSPAPSDISHLLANMREQLSYLHSDQRSLLSQNNHYKQLDSYRQIQEKRLQEQLLVHARSEKQLRGWIHQDQARQALKKVSRCTQKSKRTTY